MNSLLCLVLGIVLQLLSVKACYLQGSDVGECLDDMVTGTPEVRMGLLPYCWTSVTYPACFPKTVTLPPSRGFSQGRWNNYDMHTKDAWVQNMTETHFIERIQIERNRTLRKAGVNEYGDKGRVRRRFYKKPDCRNAFKNYMCWMNFPRCDVTRDLTLPMCRSACENFFISCGYERGLWRCGKSKYFNGYEPEPPTISALGNVSYMREYFPGQPFRENKYSPKGNSELIICTPAIDGSASRGHFSSSVLFVAITCVLCLLGLFM